MREYLLLLIPFLLQIVGAVATLRLMRPIMEKYNRERNSPTNWTSHQTSQHRR